MQAQAVHFRFSYKGLYRYRYQLKLHFYYDLLNQSFFPRPKLEHLKRKRKKENKIIFSLYTSSKIVCKVDINMSTYAILFIDGGWK